MKTKDKDVKRGLTVPELRTELHATREKLFRLRFRHRVTPLTNPMELRDLRRHAARLETWIRERSENKE
ncbi:MAG: 50S ribosomal protein L29 [Elusimicrobia bacterium]|nr:50S ribosomal protein L29 [Elusimicrobiota bacterium]